MIKKLFVAGLLLIGLGLSAEAQVSVGIYQSGVFTYLGAGTDPEKRYFGEARIFAGDVLNHFFGAEVIGQRNFKQSDWYNFSAGLMVGYHEFDDARVGLPAFFTIKPIQSNKNFSLILEATPFVAYSSVYFRGNLGIRYFLRKAD
ncbi:hypothetical protein [Lunatibacter salilacus]|uniref:hypothetical protein n=1 Tax=Lunatibacter salilacus TaxID=2483804 RepID=UPI00131D6255|nr:hypothetical protein [Lunatibacter salilacus]